MTTQKKEKGPLGRADWITVALKVLAREGIDGVRVERLSLKLGVTKGSFYWHFKDRAALLDGMLDHWRTHVVLGIMEQLERVSDPLDRYRQMMGLPFGDRGPDFDLELGIRLWARRDARAQAAIFDADERRIEFIMAVIIAAGAPADTARARAVLIFSFIRVGGEVIDQSMLVELERLLLPAR